MITRDSITVEWRDHDEREVRIATAGIRIRSQHEVSLLELQQAKLDLRSEIENELISQIIEMVYGPMRVHLARLQVEIRDKLILPPLHDFPVTNEVDQLFDTLFKMTQGTWIETPTPDEDEAAP